MNREIFPGGIYPLQGDVASQAGANNVVVTGIQNVPVSSVVPNLGNVLQATTVGWAPASLQGSILINGIPVSDDYDIYFNSPGLHGQVLFNGS